MCGICCLLEQNAHVSHSQFERLQRRGPNHSQSNTVHVSECQTLTLMGHVLHLRGQLTPQPLCNNKGDNLLWNGEIFGGVQVKEDENDTEVLLEILGRSSEPSHILVTMAAIKGPWSFIYWQQSSRRLWFGRDVFGRRSLLWHLPETDDDQFILSSVRIGQKSFNEVPSIGIFCIDLSEEGPNQRLSIKLYARHRAVWPGTMDRVNGASLRERIYPNLVKSEKIIFEMDNSQMCDDIPKLNKSLPDLIVQEEKVADHKQYIEDLLLKDEFQNKLADQLIDVLLKAVKTRVYNQTYLKDSDKTCSEMIKSKDITSVTSKVGDESQSSQQCGNIEDKLREYDGEYRPQQVSCPDSRDECNDNVICKVQDNDALQDGAVAQKLEQTSEAKVAILFSGGIDSAVLTALVDRCLPISEPVDLINVAFEHQIKANSTKKREASSEDMSSDQRWRVPDRETGYTALAELSQQRQWNFVEVNVTLSELQQVRSEAIRHLVYPLDTVLDDSIGSAVWFAAKGQGIMGNGEHAGKPYQSTARVILCGMGADEQFAGYSRHRGKYQESGWQGLVDEIEMEVSRISARNLGRDDRVITDHGKEARFPFLDEDVVSFLQQLPIHHKTNLNLPRGLGEKLLLRLCATKLGLINTATFPKRAIQFGSRIAKMENSKEKASDKCSRLN